MNVLAQAAEQELPGVISSVDLARPREIESTGDRSCESW